MISEERIEEFYNAVQEAEGDNSLGNLFAEISEELFNEIGIDLTEGGYNDPFDFIIDGTDKLLEVKESSQNHFSMSEEEKNEVDYFLGFVRNDSDNYRDFDYIFLNRDELNNIVLGNGAKGISRQTNRLTECYLSFHQLVEKIKDEMKKIGLKVNDDEINESSFFSQYNDRIKNVVENESDPGEIGRLGEIFMCDILEDNNRSYIDLNDKDDVDKLEKYGFSNEDIFGNGNKAIFDILDDSNKNNLIRIEMKTSGTDHYSHVINPNDFDILVMFFAYDEKVRYGVYKSEELNHPTFYFKYSKSFDETDFMRDYLKAIGES